MLYVEIDFNSDDALYIQLRDQIILQIALNAVREGESLPSVRQLANTLGINMHTVNKAYAVLKEEGYIQLDRRRGAVINVNRDRERLLTELAENLRLLIAACRCKNITRADLHTLVDEIFDEYI